MTRFLLAMTAILLLGAPALAAGAAGEWLVADRTARIRIAPCGDALCGTIAWAQDPGTDEHNPDPALRNRSVVGLTILQGMKPAGENRWEGRIYNPDDGKTYRGTMSLEGADVLRVQGCVLGGVICDSEDWTRTR